MSIDVSTTELFNNPQWVLKVLKQAEIIGISKRAIHRISRGKYDDEKLIRNMDVIKVEQKKLNEFIQSSVRKGFTTMGGDVGLPLHT